MATVSVPASTAVLEFVQTSASGDFGLRCLDYSITTITGQPRTAGKNVVQCKLTADVAVVASTVFSGSTAGGTTTANAGLDPSGMTYNGTAFADNSSNSVHYANLNCTAITNTTQTVSIFLGRGTGANNRYVRVGYYTVIGLTNGFYTDVDLQLGTASALGVNGNATGTSVSITQVPGGYVVKMTGKVSSALASAPLIIINSCSAAGTTTYLGTSSQCFIYDRYAVVTASSIPDVTFNVDTDTGWLDDDLVCIAATTRTRTDCSIWPLNGTAGSSSFASVPVSFSPHSGTAPTQAEVGLLTRNVKLRSTNAAWITYVYVTPLATFTASWAEFYYVGFNASSRFGLTFDAGSPANTKSVTYCSIHDTQSHGVVIAQNAATSIGANFVFSNNVIWNSATNPAFYMGAVTDTDWVIDSNLIIRPGIGANSHGCQLLDLSGTFTNNTVVGATFTGILLAEVAPFTIGTFTGNTARASNPGIGITTGPVSGTISNLKSWRNNGVGILMSATAPDLEFENITLFGNSTTNLSVTAGAGLTIKGTNIIAGDTTFATTNGIAITGITTPFRLDMSSVDMSGSTSIYAPHTTDLNLGALGTTSTDVFGTANNCKFGAATVLPPKTLWARTGSHIGFEKYNQTAGDHRTEIKYGQLKTDTAIYKTASPSMKMTPNSTSGKLESAPKGRGIQVAVNNNYAVTASVWVRKDTLYYLSNQPRLIVRANPAIGINTDTVLATASDTTGAIATMFDDNSLTLTALSNNNLTATHTSAATTASGARGLNALGTGKYYFEVTVGTITSNNANMGILLTTASYGNMASGFNGVEVLIGGTVYANSSLVASVALGVFAAGNVLGIAVDLDTRKAWVRRNGGTWNAGGPSADPVAGTNGVTVPAGALFTPAVCFSGLSATLTELYTANFGGTAYANAAPSGYSNWPQASHNGTATWVQLSGTTAAATDDGVMEFIVDCDGTTGYINVDDWNFTAVASSYLSPGLVSDTDVFSVPVITQPVSHSAEAIAFLARTSGLDATHTNAYYDLIDGLVTDGVWSKFDVLYITATQNTTTAQLNLVSSSYALSLNGSPVFTADRGYQGGATGNGTVYIYTGLPAGFNFTTASAHLSGWSVNDTADDQPMMGMKDGFNMWAYVSPKTVAGNSAFHLNTAGATTVATSSGQGHFIANRPASSGATTIKGHRNGAVTVTNASSNAVQPPNTTIHLLAYMNQFNNKIGWSGQMAAASAGSGLTDAEALAFYNRLYAYMIAISGAGAEATTFLLRTTGLDIAHMVAYSNLINGLVADGLWTKFDMLHIYATQDSTTALLNLISSSYNGTINGSPTFTADRGFRGAEGSSTIYIDTGFNPSSASSPKFTLNSAHISAWAVDNAAPGYSQYAIMGLAGSSADTLIIPRSQFGGDARFRINASTETLYVRATQDGYFLANRSASNALQGYIDGVSVVTSSVASSGLINGTITTLSTNGIGTGHFGGPHQCAAASIGSSLTSGEVLALRNRLRTYMTAVGVP